MSMFPSIKLNTNIYIYIFVLNTSNDEQGNDEIVIEIYLLVLTGQFLNTRNKLIS